MPELLGLVSSYREGQLAVAGIESLSRVCSRMIVFEGPVGDAPEKGEPTDWKKVRKLCSHLLVVEGSWASDAEKRSAMIERTRIFPTPTWAVWLDGDEILVNGALLPAIIDKWRADENPDAPYGGFAIRFVEWDGSVGMDETRVVRVDLIERYLISNAQWLVRGSDVVLARGRKPNWLPGHYDEQGVLVTEPWAMTETYRPPLQGEPHILHCSLLRAKSRVGVQRLHVAEAGEIAELGLPAYFRKP